MCVLGGLSESMTHPSSRMAELDVRKSTNPAFGQSGCCQVFFTRAPACTCDGIAFYELTVFPNFSRDGKSEPGCDTVQPTPNQVNAARRRGRPPNTTANAPQMPLLIANGFYLEYFNEIIVS
jgi:hypothetical protein